MGQQSFERKALNAKPCTLQLRRGPDKNQARTRQEPETDQTRTRREPDIYPAGWRLGFMQAKLLTLLILGPVMVGVAIASLVTVQNAELVSVRFLRAESIQLPLGIVLTGCLLTGVGSVAVAQLFISPKR